MVSSATLALVTAFLLPPAPVPSQDTAEQRSPPTHAITQIPVGDQIPEPDPAGDPASPLPEEEAGVWPADTNDTRLLLGPTARTLKSGETYLDDLSLFFPSVNVGLSNRVSLGVGTVFLLPTAELHPGEIAWFTPKLQVFSGRHTQASLGLVHLTGKGANLGIAYGVVTHGSPDGAFSVGFGTSYGLGKGGGSPVLMVGGERRVGRRLKLLSENYLAGMTPLFFGGVRRINRRSTLDLIWTKAGSFPVYPVPIIRFTVQMTPGHAANTAR